MQQPLKNELILLSGNSKDIRISNKEARFRLKTIKYC